ncbi:methionine ABC transporter ATP-binding protein [Acidocella sp.]|jgi:D-methionine transport system ATP-binding protein|uniref:methionine ABC transporter ATP-binding protein n=1 Tax=Acidocella sp. TaxID=50710 RepID=UPI0039B74A4D
MTHASHTSPLVTVEQLCRRFGKTQALADISFTLERGQVLSVIGRSGAGKSTLLRCLNGLERPDEGRIVIDGKDIVGCGERDLRVVRQRIGMIFQHFNLLSAKTALGNVALPLKLRGIGRAARHARAAELLDLVGLADKAGHYPAQLSGGQKQRVGIARALASDPALLLCDEATSALDPEATLSILELLGRINRELGLTIVLITHEMNVARLIADRVLVLAAGRIVEEGVTRAVLSHPKAAETRLMLRAAGFLPDTNPQSGTRHAQLAV